MYLSKHFYFYSQAAYISFFFLKSDKLVHNENFHYQSTVVIFLTIFFKIGIEKKTKKN